jgi:hypothetical protein
VITIRDPQRVPVPEPTHGRGDLLVGESFSRSPHALTHKTFPVNHAAELWDGPVKEHVLKILGGPRLDA